MKLCLTCNTVKVLACMVKHAGRSDGYMSRCKSCAASKERARWAVYGRGPDGPAQLMLNAARQRARNGSYPCTITLADLVIPERCPVLGLVMSHGGDRDSSPSLDKIIPRLGYVPGNVVIVSMRANRLKSDATPQELRLLADFFN